jgi:tRNA (uracil-5-)-methyltransferase TRM9
MKLETIKQLNQLNQRFYQTIATEFSDSRQYAWSGWERALTFWPFPQVGGLVKVLDLGCGNGRFGLFLSQKMPSTSLQYVGLDSSPELLQLAEESLKATELQYKLGAIDLVEELLVGQLDQVLSQHHPTIITLFGVLHHIPSYHLRQQLINCVAQALPSGGWLVLAAWQFMDSPRLAQKVVNPAVIGISTSELETNDYILDWQRGKTSYRYCHWVDTAELSQLVSPQIWEKVADFTADAKEENLNHYLVLKKKTV